MREGRGKGEQIRKRRLKGWRLESQKEGGKKKSYRKGRGEDGKERGRTKGRQKDQKDQEEKHVLVDNGRSQGNVKKEEQIQETELGGNRRIKSKIEEKERRRRRSKKQEQEGKDDNVKGQKRRKYRR